MDEKKIKTCFANVVKSLDRTKKSLEEEEYKKLLRMVNTELWQRLRVYIDAN